MPVRRGSLRWRFAVGAVVSAASALILFGAITFALVLATEEAEADDARAAGRERSDESPAEEATGLVAVAMAIAAPIALLAAIAAAAALSRRTAKPLDLVVRAARSATAHHLSVRLEPPEREGELRDLIVALNELFARLEDGFGALGRFAADASHELRTPISIVAAELEVALRHPRSTSEWEASAARGLTQLRRLGAIVDGLLTLARAGAEAPGTRSRASVVELVDGLLAQSGVFAEAAGVALIGPEAPTDAEIDVNASAVETAIRNLLENAIRCAHSRVEVGLEVTADRVRVVVDDDGHGLGPDPDALFEPLVRGPTGPSDRAGGAGLGLAIARRVAEAHGGRLDPAAAPLGGARLVLELPVAPRGRTPDGQDG